LVRATASGTFNFSNSNRVISTSPVTFIREGVSSDDVVRMTFTTSTGADEIVVSTNGESIEKMFSPATEAPALFVRGADLYTVASVASINADTRIELGMKGNGLAKIEGLNVPAGLTAYVVNARTGSISAINTGSSFGASENDRLAIIFRSSVEEASANLYAYRAENSIRVVLAGNADGSVVEVLDATGKLVSRSNAAAGSAEVSVAAPSAAGVYQVRVSGSVNGVTRVAAGF
jgi:hypothetical protein